ncbi:DNA-directed RNA polymerase [Nannizzia gypsea CBS 118893]|uniref:DNA-directed RNA polymerase n=1 Tax=Arthroderma gypseum (strain ATCC MYA-4604 / CBS 118893) TaxID=535722 RepID=E4UVQ3_ARTGP|nr:DNA-directed RNA polymerase [Nannizzia gypsea CBS 118893]EFR02380.1 DNA-directed RNA polymerase [Nannizzia gypsea CBS 118893]
MLSRVAHRKHALYRLQRAHEPLVLPWLCPALLRSQLTTKCGPIRPIAKQNVASAISHPTSRSLATVRWGAMDDHHSTYIPFEGLDAYKPVKEPDTLPPQFTSRPPLSDPSDPVDRDASSVIILNPLLSSKPTSLRKIKSIGGDLDEMLINLDVSLSAGMFKRASLLLRRLAAAYPQGSPELLDLHNKYLRSMITYMIVNRQPDLVWYAQRWYEVDMGLLSVKPDAITLAWMLRMSLRMLAGPKRERTVRRYWQSAVSRDIHEDILQSSILPESELGLLSEICFHVSEPSEGAVEPDLAGPDRELDLKPKVTDESVLPPNEIMNTDQKGLGLDSLKESLSLFNPSTEFTPKKLWGRTPEEREQNKKRLRQEQLEKDSLTSAIERWRKESEGAIGQRRQVEAKLNAFMYEWYQGVLGKIKEELDLAKRSESKKKLTSEESERCEYIPFLLAVGPSKLAAVTILSVLGSIGSSGMDKGIKLSSLFTNIGRAVKDEYIVETTRRSAIEEAQNENEVYYLNKTFRQMKVYNTTGKFRSYMQKHTKDQPPVHWPASTEIKIGALLSSMLFSTAEIPTSHKDPVAETVTYAMEPAFQHVYQLQKGHNVGYVQLHEKVVERLRKEPSGNLLAKHLPMVSTPRPWVSNTQGGFLTQPTQVVRTRHDDAQSQYLQAASDRGDLDELYKGLTILGKTGWKINRPVFDVMLEAWNSGEEVANIVAANLNLPELEKPDAEDREAIKTYYRAKTRADNKKMGNHSQRCYLNFQMEIARAYLNESFYLPHNMDFRGRAYPLPPYFNQMGADNCRGLLLFSEGRVLGESGLRWLRIHLSNVFGYDKASFQEREQFSIDHVEEILDSANNGLKGKRWWLKAADPFQCLAACVELKNALSLPDPTQYVSHLPVHQDGSCNGLQHYAALGGDAIGARQVNLEPGDRPSDIYTAVAEHVKASIANDAKAGDPIAKLMDGKITRKVVKQTVMTNVYGVTFIGATRQVRRQIEDHYPELAESDEISKCAVHVSRAIFSALNSMFSGAHDIQFWLGDCANRVTRSLNPSQIEEIRKELEAPSKTDLSKKLKFNNSVIWTTPLKLPVVQPYREAKARQIPTSLQLCTIKDVRGANEVNRRKQLQAFPPNFIHSLDATHMMLSAIKCDELGLNFSAVHDSFWTHAGDIDKMNRVLRDAFVRMHSDDIVGRLAAEFDARYSNNLYLAQLRPNTVLAKKIKALRAAKGRSGKQDKVYELLDEYKRIELLKSEDPAEQEKGRNMITPGSLFAATEGADETLVSVQSLGVAGMGHVPPPEEQKALEDAMTAEGSSSPVDTVPETPEMKELQECEADAELATKSKKKSKAQATSVWVWLPLTFREVPQKGEFDVRRLKESQYFFS